MTGLWRRRPRKGRGLAPHVPMPKDAPELQPDFSEPRVCGCRWVPCDEHADAALRIMHEDGEGL